MLPLLKKGHYRALCLSKVASAHSLEADLTCIDTAFLDNLLPTDQETAWLTHIQHNVKQTPFKIDMGAEVTAISQNIHERLVSPTLDTPSKILYGSSKQPLQVLGSFKGTFNHRDKESTQQVFVVEELKSYLLGLPAIMALQLAARLDAIDTNINRTTVQTKLPIIFQSLKNLGEDFTIQMKPDATPYALFTPCDVSLPLRPQGEESMYGVNGGYIQGRRTNNLVCRYGPKICGFL